MEYVKPILEIVYCEQTDIITTSLDQFDNIGDDINWENG